ncbi:uncharacterized protein LOC117039744 [Lacerta agilis]|uniref:uncharacterized protein LOC117039744 n=1 Tax=Lacerta agilis TaxID=80427 RepID=UPI001419FB11|nr:uncharacterized protein LOC117039744 [Lacerta agilis]
MGRRFSYAHCPDSPTEMPKEPSSPKWKLWATVGGFVVTLVLLFIFLCLFVVWDVKLHECELRQGNHTSSADGRMTESDVLRAQLAAVNQSLANTTKYWTTCQEDLKHLRENTSVLNRTVRDKEEALKQLNGTITNLQNQLADLRKSQETLKQEGDKKDKEIQQLNEKLSERQASSGVVLFGDPITSFLLVIAPGLLCGLL